MIWCRKRLVREISGECAYIYPNEFNELAECDVNGCGMWDGGGGGGSYTTD
jgi:hypothetical protein